MKTRRKVRFNYQIVNKVLLRGKIENSGLNVRLAVVLTVRGKDDRGVETSQL